ncbi:MAG: glucoamylase family protein [Fimbriimonas sp.]
MPAVCLFILATLHAPTSGAALLDDIQHRAVNFFWNESNPKTGFAKDRASNFEKSDKYDVASCASTGFALAAYPIGVERKWLDREKAKERTLTTLRSLLDVHEGHKGWYYHFTNWETGKRVWNSELSSIDSSILFGGVIASERYWKDKQVSELADRLLKRVDFKWMMTDGGAKPEEGIFSMGWRPDTGFIESRWSGYSEEKMLYLQAYGLVPSLANHGFDKTNRQEKSYKGIDFLNGGPLFIHQMSESFYSFSDLRDKRGYNYWVSTHNAILANRQYCIDNPGKFKGYGPNFWGLSACDTPDGYKALGAPGWIDDNGTITPTSAVAGMPYTPKESTAFLESMLKEHPKAWGRYGFSNGVNPSRDWVDPDVIGIDLGMMLLAVENARTGMIWKLSSSYPAIKVGYERMGFRKVAGSNRGKLRE